MSVNILYGRMRLDLPMPRNNMLQYAHGPEPRRHRGEEWMTFGKSLGRPRFEAYVGPIDDRQRRAEILCTRRSPLRTRPFIYSYFSSSLVDRGRMRPERPIFANAFSLELMQRSWCEIDHQRKRRTKVGLLQRGVRRNCVGCLNRALRRS